MRRRLPPLNAVVAFESAARNNSFKKAGDELCVTASAISHQVRSLEYWLGVKLFERSARVIELTDSGTRYMLALSPLLNQLEECANNERHCRENKTITIQSTDSFISRWLIPRLSEFESLHPDIALKIVTYDFRDGLRSSEADLGILFITDKQNASGKRDHMRLLFAEEIFPVCSPKIIPNRDVSVADLSNFILIHDDNIGVSWQDWIATAMQTDSNTLTIETQNGPHYNHSHLALKCAELGGGFTLASNTLTDNALDKGILIAPFKDKIITGCGYYLAESEKSAVRAHCRPFTEWIFSRC